MNVAKRNDVSIYCLSSGPTLPEWLGERARRNLSKKDENIRRRIELLQDFQMPSSSSKIIQSADGRYIIAAGTYPPRIKCYDVHELSVKFERYVDSHVVDMVMLGEDYGKFALLLEDRTIAFHAPYGKHENIRIPTFGRAIDYEPTTCELLVAAKGNNVYRVNLEEGHFSEPWSYDADASSTCISVAPSQPMTAVGCDDGVVRFWDNRSPDSLLKPFLQLDVHRATAGHGFADDSLGHVNTKEITSIAHDPNGLYMACGTAGGLAAVYDVRSSRPLYIQEHKNGTPICAIKFHSSGNIISMDEKLIKVWRYKSSWDVTNSYISSDSDRRASTDEIGSVLVNVEGTGKLSNFIMAGDETDPFGYKSGMILCSGDQPKMESYYIPKMGLAPRWCSFLDNITEELEETDLKRNGDAGKIVRDGEETIYENYKFVSRDDIDELGISNLVGTPLLKGYMHGFFMDVNLYNRVRAVAKPFEYEEYRKNKIKQRLEEKRSSRIAPKKENSKKTKSSVNPDLAERLRDKADSDTKAGKVASQLLSDDRFGNLFTDPDFEIDQADDAFKLRNPSGVAASKKKKNDLDSDDEDGSSDEREGFGEGRDKEEDAASLLASDDGVEDDSDSDEDGFRGGKVRGEDYKDMKNLGRKKPKNKAEKSKKSKKRVIYEGDDLEGVSKKANESGDTEAINEMTLPLAKRIALQKEKGAEFIPIKSKFGSKKVAYVPRSDLKRAKEVEQDDSKFKSRQRSGRRRGIKELGLKSPKF